MASLFVTFEGGEGAGKTTLIRKLEAVLRQQGAQVVVTREPGGTSLGEQIRHLLLNQHTTPISPLSELLLFLTARAQHIEELIRPALKQGKVVLCDRFNDSSIAYQGIARDLGKAYVEQLCQQVCQDVVPDITFYLDLDPKTGMERALKEHRVLDRLEQEKAEFHERVRQGFLQIARQDKGRVVVVDASQPPEAVFGQAFAALTPFLQDVQD